MKAPDRKHCKSYLSNYYDFYVKSKDKTSTVILWHKIFMLNKLNLNGIVSSHFEFFLGFKYIAMMNRIKCAVKK